MEPGSPGSVKKETNMKKPKFAIAIDHKCGYERDYTFIAFFGPSNLDIREIRNWFLLHKRLFKQVSTAQILRRHKGDFYAEIETVYPNGVSYATYEEVGHDIAMSMFSREVRYTM